MSSSKSQEKLAPKASKSAPLKSPRGGSSPSRRSSAKGRDDIDGTAETSIVDQLKDMGTKYVLLHCLHTV